MKTRRLYGYVTMWMDTENDRYDTIPITIEIKITQSSIVEMWYQPACLFVFFCFFFVVVFFCFFFFFYDHDSQRQ